MPKIAAEEMRGVAAVADDIAPLLGRLLGHRKKSPQESSKVTMTPSPDILTVLREHLSPQAKMAAMLKEARSQRVEKLAVVLRSAGQQVGPPPVKPAPQPAPPVDNTAAATAAAEAAYKKRKPMQAGSVLMPPAGSGGKHGADFTKKANLAKLLGTAANFTRGAFGAGTTKGVRQAQNLVGTVSQRNRNALLGQRDVAGSPQHQQLMRPGATFKPTGRTVPMQGGVPVRPTIKNLDKLRASPGNTGGQLDANLQAMISNRRMYGNRSPVQAVGIAPDVMRDVRAGSQRAAEVARQYAPQQAAYRAGKDMAVPVQAGLGAAGGLGAAYGLDKLSMAKKALQGSKKLSAVRHAAMRKLAGRIINADVGLEAIIEHIKAARSKKMATA